MSEHRFFLKTKFNVFHDKLRCLGGVNCVYSHTLRKKFIFFNAGVLRCGKKWERFSPNFSLTHP